MAKSLIELHQERGRLLERSAMQRHQLGQQLAPLAHALAAGDHALGLARSGLNIAQSHPMAITAALAALFALRPGLVWRWGRRGFILWRGWRALANWAPAMVRRWFDPNQPPPGR